ncbi:MAG: hypothetical protein KAT96_03225 [Candidatus Omnitrophica bacterium]|nr:hypothetical protein [Candidatus Omnitrophota bacterium]
MKNFLVLLFLIIIVGCGYTTRGFVYTEDSIIIKPVVNKINITSESRKYSNYVSFPILIENRLTNELVSKFNIEGNLKVVSHDPGALSLACIVEGYNRETLRYTESDDPDEQRLRLNVHIKLTSPEGKILQDRVVVGETTYYFNSKTESAAQLDLIDDTARRICEAVTEEW